jgi:hypothetical protein
MVGQGPRWLSSILSPNLPTIPGDSVQKEEDRILYVDVAVEVARLGHLFHQRDVRSRWAIRLNQRLDQIRTGFLSLRLPSPGLSRLHYQFQRRNALENAHC